MNQKGSVSVVIPAYNAAEFIKDSVNSCFNQTYRPLEVIVVNDGSGDSTLQTAQELSESIQDSQLELRTIDIGKNKGVANALNVGFSSAKGVYVCWLSADDMFIDKEKIQKQVTNMYKTKAAWSYYRDFYAGFSLSSAIPVSGSYLPHLRLLDPLFIPDSDLRLMMLLFRNPINGSSIMIQSESVEEYGQFDPIVRNVDADGDLWMRYSALGAKLNVLKGAAVFYREHAAQTSKKKAPMMHGCELTRMRMLLTLEKKGDLARLVKKFAPYFLMVLRTKQHFNRPFTSEFLFDYIVNHGWKFNRLFVKLIRRSSTKLRKHPNYTLLDKNRFFSDLELFRKSYTFKRFEEVFLKYKSET